MAISMLNYLHLRGITKAANGNIRRRLSALKEDAKVLEVGCGKGEFLKLLVAKGIGAIGLDTNHNAIEAARSARLMRLMLIRGIMPRATTEKFDVVCHFQVLDMFRNLCHFSKLARNY